MYRRPHVVLEPTAKINYPRRNEILKLCAHFELKIIETFEFFKTRNLFSLLCIHFQWHLMKTPEMDVKEFRLSFAKANAGKP